MWTVIGAALAVISSVVAYYLRKKAKSPRRKVIEDLEKSWRKRERIRSKVEKSAYDLDNLRKLELQLKIRRSAKRHPPKGS